MENDKFLYNNQFDDSILKSSCNLYINYESDKNIAYIESEDTIGNSYKCETIVELKDAIESYLHDYVINEYEKEQIIINIYETDEDLEHRTFYRYSEIFSHVTNAILTARKLVKIIILLL